MAWILRHAGPARPGPSSCGHRRRDLGDRLLHRRDDRSQDALRPVLHRALDAAVHPLASRPILTRRGSPSRRGTSPTASGCRCSVPPARPGRQVHRTLRCGAPRRGRPGHPNADPRTSGECLRGAVRKDRAPGVPRPGPDLRSSAPRAVSSVRRALPRGATTSGLGLAVPAGDRPPHVPEATGVPRVERRDVLSGLIHEYRRSRESDC